MLEVLGDRDLLFQDLLLRRRRDQVLEVRGHLVEGPLQGADLVAAPDLDAGREVALAAPVRSRSLKWFTARLRPKIINSAISDATMAMSKSRKATPTNSR